MQETILAKEAYCVRGDHILPWNKVGRAAQWLKYREYHSHLNLRRTLPGVESAAKIQDYKANYVDRCDILLEANGLQTVDPRDKVFGFMGLLQTTDNGMELLSTGIRPDYSVPVDILYAQVTRAYIRADESLRIFSELLSTRVSRLDLKETHCCFSKIGQRPSNVSDNCKALTLVAA